MNGSQLLDYDAARSKARKLAEKDDAIKLRAVRPDLYDVIRAPCALPVW